MASSLPFKQHSWYSTYQDKQEAYYHIYWCAADRWVITEYVTGYATKLAGPPTYLPLNWELL